MSSLSGIDSASLLGVVYCLA